MRAKQQLWAFAVLVVLTCGSMAAQDDAVQVPIREDQPVLEFVGQFINAGSSSQQFGYVSKIKGLSPIFSGTLQNETTAMFTFFTQATTVRVIVNGALRIINRVGTTTIYFNPNPAGDFTNPSSFRLGIPILVSGYTQQVVSDTITGAFTTVHLNTITATSVFSLGSVGWQLGHVGRSFRTNYSGHANAPGMLPNGWFGGYAVGVD